MASPVGGKVSVKSSPSVRRCPPAGGILVARIREPAARPDGCGAPAKCRAMNAVAYATVNEAKASAAARRSDFSIAIMQICLGISAEHYMVLDTACGPDGAEVHILASNWMYDAIEMVGLAHLAGLARSRIATPLGGDPEPLVVSQNKNGNSRICGNPESELARFGHQEIYVLQVGAGARSASAFLSASGAGRIRRDLVSAAQFRCAYLLSEFRDGGAGGPTADPLSERERECLFWVVPSAPLRIRSTHCSYSVSRLQLEVASSNPYPRDDARARNASALRA